MNISFSETIGGDFFIMDEDEDAPLIEIRFNNEAKKLPLAVRRGIARAAFSALEAAGGAKEGP